MCETNRSSRNIECDEAQCETDICDAGVTDVLGLKMDKFVGKIMCIGKQFTPEKKKRIRKPQFPPLEGWISRREVLALKEKEVKKKFGNRVRLRGPDERYQRAMTTRLELPQHAARDIRRVRFPYTVALVMELEEDGFLTASSILQGFIHYNDTMRSMAMRGSPFFDEPPLSERPELLEKVARALAAMDSAGQTDPPDFALQIDSLLDMAYSLLNHGETVAWIVEKVLLMAISIASNYAKDGHKREAMARFAYGCFLLHFSLFDNASHELEIARNLAIGKTWILNFEYEKKYDILHLEITDVLCRIFLLMARRVRAANPYQAVRFCSKALRRVGDKALKVLEAEALLELGLAYKEGGNYIMAEQAFLEYLRRYTDISYANGICTAYLEGALCYSRLGNVKKAQEFLYYVLKAAEQTGLEHVRARAQRYIGESFLKMGYYKEASRCLEDSFQMNVKLKNVKETDYIRLLAGVSKGMEIMPQVATLLNECITELTGNSLFKLLLWRFHRKPFWDVTQADAPELPDSSLYSQLPEDPEVLRSVVRSSLERKMEIFKQQEELTGEQRDREALRWKLQKRKEEEYGQAGLFVRTYLPGYEPAVEQIPPELSFTSAYSARMRDKFGRPSEDEPRRRSEIEREERAAAEKETQEDLDKSSDESDSSGSFDFMSK